MITGAVLRDSIISGSHTLQNNRVDVDELNVFPVPDGDTGTNMCMTIGNAEKALAALPNDVTVDKVAATTASAMLRGARGNSGVILSLLFRGFAKALTGKTTADAADLRAALTSGVEGAYKAVMKPTEGTILTVARLASEDANKSEVEDVLTLWRQVVATAEVALEQTPELLPILKQAGVVDAGGQGLVHIFNGMLAVFAGGQIAPLEDAPTPEKKKLRTSAAGKGVFNAELNPDITNGYCTEFLINKEANANAEKLRAFLESNGDSVVVVDDDEIIKAHVHTADPGKVLTHAITHGYLTNLKIENMHEQYVARQEEARGLDKQAAAEGEGEPFPYAAVVKGESYGFVSIAAGEGVCSVFSDLGVNAIVTGGQTMNPSTEDILAAVHSVGAEHIFVLPNNKNIIMAAEQAAALADRKTTVLPTRTIPQGMSAMLSFDPSADANTNTIAMNAAAEKVVTCQITYAARNSEFDGHKIKKGEILAMQDGKLALVEKDMQKAFSKAVRGMVKKDSTFITILYGEGVSAEEAEAAVAGVRSKIPADIEIVLQNGGQPVYYYIISVE